MRRYSYRTQEVLVYIQDHPEAKALIHHVNNGRNSLFTKNCPTRPEITKGCDVLLGWCDAMKNIGEGKRAREKFRDEWTASQVKNALVILITELWCPMSVSLDDLRSAMQGPYKSSKGVLTTAMKQASHIITELRDDVRASLVHPSLAHDPHMNGNHCIPSSATPLDSDMTSSSILASNTGNGATLIPSYSGPQYAWSVANECKETSPKTILPSINQMRDHKDDYMEQNTALLGGALSETSLLASSAPAISIPHKDSMLDDVPSTDESDVAALLVQMRDRDEYTSPVEEGLVTCNLHPDNHQRSFISMLIEAGFARDIRQLSSEHWTARVVFLLNFELVGSQTPLFHTDGSPYFPAPGARFDMATVGSNRRLHIFFGEEQGQRIAFQRTVAQKIIQKLKRCGELIDDSTQKRKMSASQ